MAENDLPSKDTPGGGTVKWACTCQSLSMQALVAFRDELDLKDEEPRTNPTRKRRRIETEASQSAASSDDPGAAHQGVVHGLAGDVNGIGELAASDGAGTSSVRQLSPASVSRDPDPPQTAAAALTGDFAGLRTFTGGSWGAAFGFALPRLHSPQSSQLLASSPLTPDTRAEIEQFKSLWATLGPSSSDQRGVKRSHETLEAKPPNDTVKSPATGNLDPDGRRKPTREVLMRLLETADPLDKGLSEEKEEALVFRVQARRTREGKSAE